MRAGQYRRKTGIFKITQIILVKNTRTNVSEFRYRGLSLFKITQIILVKNTRTNVSEFRYRGLSLEVNLLKKSLPGLVDQDLFC
jgi:hypothetical protein